MPPGKLCYVQYNNYFFKKNDFLYFLLFTDHARWNETDEQIY